MWKKKLLFIGVTILLMLNGCSAVKDTKMDDEYKGTLEIMDSEGEVIITTDNLTSVSYEEGEDETYYVEIQVDEDGTKKMATFTMEQIGGVFPVYVNGIHISSSTVVNAITDGIIRINGLDSLHAYGIVNAIKNGAEVETTGKNTENMQKESEVDTKELNNELMVELPEGFIELTEGQETELPDIDGLMDAVGLALESIGVQEIVSTTYGNYEKIGTVFIALDTYVVTDLRKLIIKNQYLNDKWSVTFINDAENGNMYYPVTGKNAYDYISGECINPVVETESVEEIPHREGMYGISDKDVYDIGSPSTFARNKLHNDTTGRWRVSTISENIQMIDYALSYFEKYFHSKDEIHGIVNFNYNTTTCITYMSGQLYVTVYEYVDGEEYDAKLLFSGHVLADYIVYTDNGDIEKIQ